MANFARCNRLGAMSVASMLREQSNRKTTSRPSIRPVFSCTPHCGRAMANPRPATTSTRRTFFSTRRQGLCERVSSSRKCGAAISANCRRRAQAEYCCKASNNAGPRKASQSQRGSAKCGAERFIQFTSWHSAKSRIRQNQFQRQQTECGQQRPLEQGTVGGKAAELYLRFFEPVDIVVNVLQFLAIGRQIELGMR